MALERTALGSVPQRLRKAPQVNPDRTAGILQKLTMLGSGIAKEYNVTQKNNMQRKAERDVINGTINPDLTTSSAIYSGKVIEYEQAEKYNTLKADIKSGKYSDYSPEDFQKILDSEHKDKTASFMGSDYSDINQEIYSKFWLKNEGNLVAAQRGMATKKLKENQESLYLDNLRTKFNPNMDQKTMESVVSSVYSDAGDLVDSDYKIKALATGAGLLALEGDDRLLDVLNEKFNIAVRPDTTSIYKAGKVAVAKAKSINDKHRQLELLIDIDKKVQEGTFTTNDALTAIDNKDFKQTPNWLLNKVSTSNKVRIRKSNIDSYVQSVSAGKVSNIVLSKIDRDKADTDVVTTIIDNEKDPERRGAAIATLYNKQDHYPEVVKKELEVFSSSNLYTDSSNTEVNPNIVETYKFLKGIDKNPTNNPHNFRSLFKENKDALRMYTDIDTYMGTFQGSEEERMRAAIGKVQQIQETAGKIPTDLISVRYKDVSNKLDTRLSDDRSYLFWKNTKDDVMRNTFKGMILQAAKNELRMGRSPDAALDIAEKIVNNNFSSAFGQLQNTGGVSIAHRNGFSTQKELDNFFTYAVDNVPEIHATMIKAFGEDFDLKEESIYYDKDLNTITIGGDAEAPVTLNVETLKGLHTKYTEDQRREEIKRLKKSAEKITEDLNAADISANNDFSHRMIQAEEGTLTGSAYTSDREFASAKYEKAMSSLPAPYNEMTADKYMALPAEEQTAVRHIINTKLANMSEIPGFSDTIFQRAIKFLTGRRKDIIPFKGLFKKMEEFNATVNEKWEEELNKAASAVSSFVSPDAFASIENGDILSVLKYEENRSKTGFKNDTWYPHTSKEGGTKTIGYGHKIQKGEDFSKGITEKKAEALLQKDLNKASDKVKRNWPGYDKLPVKYQKILSALQFNVKGVVTPGKWPKLAKAIKNKDNDAIRKEMVTSYRDSKGKVHYLSSRANRIADIIGI